MTSREYWKAVVTKYPTWENGEVKITIKVSSIRAFVEQSHEHGVEMGRVLGKLEKPKNSGEDVFKDLFGGLFNGK